LLFIFIIIAVSCSVSVLLLMWEASGGCLVQRSQRLDGETREEEIGRAVGRVGPSMLLTSLSESLAFFLGNICR